MEVKCRCWGREMNEDQLMNGQYVVFTYYTENNVELPKDIKLENDMIRSVFQQENHSMVKRC